MKNRKIIVCTAFREFNGNANDKIQRMFLRGLKAQTYQNFILAPTIFGQKNVEKTLQEEGIPYKAFHGDAGAFRYSFSDVVSNAASLIDKPESYILIWTCCDDLYENTFFEKVMDSLTPLSCCTSLPHINYRTIDDFNKKKVCTYTYGGIDFICFDGDVFRNPEVKMAIKEYPNMGWGGTEFFFSAVGRVFCKKMYNIWPAKVERFDNDRKASNENHAYFDMCIEHNSMTYAAFAKKYGLKGDPLKSVLCYKTSSRYPKVKLMIYYKITLNRLQNLFFKGSIYKAIPKSVKSFLKRFVGKKLNYAD